MRRPDVVIGIRKVEVRRHDSDDRVWLTVELNIFPDDLRVCPEASLP